MTPAVNRRNFAIQLGSMAMTGMLAEVAARSQTGVPSPGSNIDLLTPSARKAIDNGIGFLIARQNDDGSFGTGDYSRNVAVCGLCGMAMLAQGSTPQRGRHAVILRRCCDFILASAADSGLIFAGEGSSREPMYGHGFATLFLAEVYGALLDSVRDKLARAVKLIIDSQNTQGGWRYEPRRYEADVSVTVCQMMALRAARNAGLFIPSDTIDRAVAYLKRAQNADGGFMYMLDHPGESSFPRSAAAVVALMSAGFYNTEEVRRGVEYVRQHAPPLKSLSGHSYLLYGHYYAAQALWHMGGEPWGTWYPIIRDFLVAHQEKNGSWFEAISPEYSSAMACLILQMPNNYLPIFQR